MGNAVDKFSKVGISDKSILLIILLLILRIAAEAVALYYPNLPWLQMIYQVPTYFLSAMVIWIERNNLKEINVTGLGLAIFLLFRSFFWITFTRNIYSTISAVAFFAIAVILAFKLVNSGYTHLLKITRKDMLWLVIAFAGGVAVCLFRISFSKSDLQIDYTYWYSLVVYFFMHLSNASIDEEPLFRGFIWGLLRRMGMKESRIVFAQAAIFASVHLSYWSRPVSLIIIFMVFSLFGYIVLLSKSVSTSMIMHALDNAVSSLYA